MSDLMKTILDLHACSDSDIPEDARSAALFSLYDWIICGRAGIAEPVARTLRAFMDDEGGRGTASVLGAGLAPARMAALVNGATSHALDFDDTHFAHVGHLSVGIYPAALAVGEEVNATAPEVVAAFVIGAEAAIRIGVALGNGHYNRGFHQTATAGAFGATLAAGRLLGLGRDQMRTALGLCSTRASGLKSQFGTMGKPYNAGITAANGVEAARLARLGLSSCEDGLGGPQGFIATHADTPEGSVPPAGKWLFADVSYKFHACCHGTHAMIEAMRALPALPLDQLERVTLRTNPRWLSVCNIARPASGLEVKFSYAWLAAMVLSQRDTTAFESFTDGVAQEQELARVASKLDVIGDAGLTDMQATGEIALKDGTRMEFSHDLAERFSPDDLRHRLNAKARALLGEGAKALSVVLTDPGTLRASDLGRLLRTGA